MAIEEIVTSPVPKTAEIITELDISHIVTEDDTPVDNIFSEKQQRLLTEPLYTSWRPDRKFVAFANVGMFYALHESPVVPDVFLSMDVQVHHNWYEKQHRTYFFWEFGKPPEVVVEVVSNKEGREDGYKQSLYARIGVEYYIIFDPTHQLSDVTLRVHEKRHGTYEEKQDTWLPSVGLGIQLWEGSYENQKAIWIRWYDEDGLVATGAEQQQRAETEQRRAEAEKQRAETEKQRAETEKQRAETEQRRAEAEKQRAETAESEIIRLQAELARLKGESA